MKRGHLIAAIISMIACALLVQGAVAGFVERSIEPAGDSTYRVVLTIDGDTVAGIIESLPPGTVITDVSLPADQYRLDGTTISLAVIGETRVTYLVHGPVDPTGAIRGKWTDFLVGGEGTVAEEGDGTQGAGVPPAVPVTAATPKAGPCFSVLLAGTGLAFAGAVFCRAGGRDEG